MALETEGEGNAAPTSTPTRARVPQPSPKPSPSSGLGAVLNAPPPCRRRRRCRCHCSCFACPCPSLLPCQQSFSSLPHVCSSQACRCTSGSERSRQQRFRIYISEKCGLRQTQRCQHIALDARYPGRRPSAIGRRWSPGSVVHSYDAGSRYSRRCVIARALEFPRSVHLHSSLCRTVQLAGAVKPVSAAALAAREISEADELSSEDSDVGTNVGVHDDEPGRALDPLADRVSRLRETTAQDRSQRKVQLQEQLDAQKAALAERRSSRGISAATADEVAAAPRGAETGRGSRGRGSGVGSGRGGLVLPRGSGRGPPAARGRGGSVGSVHGGTSATAPSATEAAAGVEMVLDGAQHAPRPIRPNPKRRAKGGVFACCGAPR